MNQPSYAKRATKRILLAGSRKLREPVDRDEVEKLLSLGWSSSEIARKLKISPSSVSRIKNPNPEEEYMTDLRKLVRKAVSANRKKQRQLGYEVRDMEERTGLRGRSEAELLSILEEVGGDLEEARRLRDQRDDSSFREYDREQEREWNAMSKEEQQAIKEQMERVAEEEFRRFKEIFGDFFGGRRRKRNP